MVILPLIDITGGSGSTGKIGKKIILNRAGGVILIYHVLFPMLSHTFGMGKGRHFDMMNISCRPHKCGV